jgi:hypothetical protein
VTSPHEIRRGADRKGAAFEEAILQWPGGNGWTKACARLVMRLEVLTTVHVKTGAGNLQCYSSTFSGRR